MYGQKLQIFKRPKNREEGSDFNDIWTKKVAANQAVSRKFRTNETNEKFPPKKWKIMENIFIKFNLYSPFSKQRYDGKSDGGKAWQTIGC